MSAKDPNGFYFTDEYEPHIYRDGTESFQIMSEADLLKILQEYVQKSPRVVIIRRDDVGRMFLGMGGSLAGIRYYDKSNNSRALNAKPKGATVGEEKWFVGEGEPSHFRYTIPVATIFEVIVYFFRKGELSDLVDWV